MLKIRYIFQKLSLIITAAFLLACGDDEVESVELRDVQTQLDEDDENLLTYLQTHFYNYEDFQSNPTDYSIRIALDTLAGDNANKTPLIDHVDLKQVEVTNADGDVINHKLY